MALFPNVNAMTYTNEDAAVREQIESFHTNAMMVNQMYLHEASIDARFNAGDQTLWNELYGVPIRTRKNFTFNRLRRVTNLISGYQRRNRKSMIVTPVETGDQKTADQFTKLMMSANQNADTLDVISEAFNGAIITGMNLLQVWVDYRNDPISGEIKVDNCSYNSFIMDPYFRKKDLSDCNAMWKRSFLNKEACMSLIPDKKDQIEEMTAYYNDGKFNYLPENITLNKNLLAYDEFYYRDYRKQKILVDPDLGETIEWTGNDENLKEFLSIYPQIKVVDTTIPTVKLALLVNGSVMYNDVNPLGIDTYPFVPVFGYFDPDVNNLSLRIQGVIRGLRDSQYLYNRRKILECDSIESRSNTGYIYKEGTLVDPDDALKTGNGRSIRIKKNAEITDITPIPFVDIPQSHIELSRILAEEIQQISGVNEELLGSADDDKAGILAKLRQGGGLTTLQVLFDQLDNSQKLLGQLMVKIMQNNYTPGKVKRIIEEEPSAQFYNKSFAKYDVAIEEGFNTSTQKQLQFAQLLHLKEIGIEIPDAVLINAATLQNKEELIQAIEQQKQQVQELEQQKAQGDSAEQQATINMVNARAEYDRANARKRESDIESNEFDRLYKTAESSREEQQTNLDTIKTLKDLEDSDTNRLGELLDMERIIQEERDANDEEMGASTDELYEDQIPFEDPLVQQQVQGQQFPQEEGLPQGLEDDSFQQDSLI